MRLFLGCLVAAPSIVTAATTVQTPAVFTLNDGTKVVLSTAGSSAFRVSVGYGGAPTQPLSNPMVALVDPDAPWTQVTDGSWQGIKSEFGSVYVDEASSGFRMDDAAGHQIVLTDKDFVSKSSSQVARVGKDTCSSASKGHDVDGGTRSKNCPDGLKVDTQQDCCSACNDDGDCTSWIFSTSGPDASGKTCWLMSSIGAEKPSDDRVLGGQLPPPPLGFISVRLGSANSTTSALYYGTGGGGTQLRRLTVTAAEPHVQNTDSVVPYYYSTDGYSALGVSAVTDLLGKPGYYGATMDMGGFTDGQSGAEWSVSYFPERPQADFYLIPAPTLETATSKYLRLTGGVAKLPLYSYGFLACRWGWENRDYIWSMLSQFRNGSYPIDAWISDFEWYTAEPDYNLPQQGEPDFTDFWFNNITFPAPTEQLDQYHDDLHLRFGGIRKPRLGNSQSLVMARAQNWTIAQGSGGAAGGGRNLNYTLPEVQAWYAKQQEPLLTAGVDFFWNDEGEATYFNFHYWVQSQAVSLINSKTPNKRYFAINRAFTPGMSRFGVVTWTGDIAPKWDDLVNTPGYILNWGLMGSPFIACDIGGFSGETNDLLLTRWYQVGVFMPLMRVHSTRSAKPHFPFLWSTDAAAAMKTALNLRYALVPYHYSLVHRTYTDGILMSRPMVMDFPDDQTVLENEFTSQWMDGSSLLVAPIMSKDNCSSVYLPAGDWFTLNSTSVTTGPTNVSITNAPLDFIPAYVRAGSIVPMAPQLQYTDQLPGGPLAVHIYAGESASFVHVEDDGMSMEYDTKKDIRSTTYTWDESSTTLSWDVEGSYTGKNMFVQLQAFAHFNGELMTSEITTIGTKGSLKLR